MADIDNPRVVVIIVGFQHGHKYRIFTLFLPAVLIQFLEEIRIFVLGLGGVGFVFHFKHDGNELQSRFIKVAEDEVALGARCGNFIVLAKFGSGEGIGADLVKLRFRIDFQTFSDGLGGLLGLEVLVKFHLFIGSLELDLVITANRRQGQFTFLFLKG